MGISYCSARAISLFLTLLQSVGFDICRIPKSPVPSIIRTSILRMGRNLRNYGKKKCYRMLKELARFHCGGGGPKFVPPTSFTW